MEAQSRPRNRHSWTKRLLHSLVVGVGALVLTVAFFLVLPLMESISAAPLDDLIVQNIDTAELPPPPPPPIQEEAEPEPETKEPPPQLADELAPLDLAQLELALNPGLGEGSFEGDFSLSLNVVNRAVSTAEVEELFSVSDLDQKPRPIYQPSPVLDAKARKSTPGTVHVVFMVNESGRVEEPMVQSSSDPALERSALNAIKQWKFEPGKRSGQPVKFRTRQTITFPKS